jgi:hypothetical protein
MAVGAQDTKAIVSSLMQLSDIQAKGNRMPCFCSCLQLWYNRRGTPLFWGRVLDVDSNCAEHVHNASPIFLDQYNFRQRTVDTD